MADHTTGTREEWQSAREELAKLEAEYADLGRRLTEERRRLPWVPVEKEYVFDTADGKKTLAELFDGRSQLLAYNIMFGPAYELGACPGCTNLGDELDEGTRFHLAHRDHDVVHARLVRRLRERHVEGVEVAADDLGRALDRGRLAVVHVAAVQDAQRPGIDEVVARGHRFGSSAAISRSTSASVL